MSADPFVPSPGNLQSYNRYSYVLNNPLSYTDPSGFFVKKALKRVARVVRSGARFIRSNWRPIAAIGLSAWAGGNFGDVVSNSLKGFAAGAAGGGISAHFGGATLTSRTLSGGIGGAVQTGNLQGIVRRMAGGIIPNSVLPQWQAVYESNKWAHTLLSVASDGLRGAVIGGRDGARFAMSWGLANNAIGHTFGFLASGAKPRFERGAWHYDAPKLPGTDAIALGNVVSWDQSYYADRPTKYSSDFAHETQGHVKLQAAMNVAYLPVHAISQWLFGGLGGREFMEFAPFIGEYPYPER